MFLKVDQVPGENEQHRTGYLGFVSLKKATQINVSDPSMMALPRAAELL